MSTAATESNITVVINTYNDRTHIGKAIQSVLDQTFKPVEIIVIDDGSTDGTEDFCRSTFGSQVLFHYHPNRGLAGSRNVALRLSSGYWIAFLDSDDYWVREKLEMSIAETRGRPDIGMVACAGIEVTPQGKPVAVLSLPKPFTMAKVRSDLRRRNPFTPSGVMIRRDVLEAVGGWPEDLRYAEDIVTFARIAASFEIAALHRPLFYKLQLPTSLSFRADAVLRYGPISFQRCKDALGRRTWPGSWLDALAFRQAVAQVFIHAAWIYTGRQDNRNAAACLARGLARWPLLTLRQYRSVYWICARLLRPHRLP
jgi:glycosyltransferase involved in cell wall biosynthesis